MEQRRVAVVIVAGGSGRRMGGALPKQFSIVGGEPVLVRTINAFAQALPGAKIVVVLPASQKDYWRNLAARFTVARHSVVDGGAERFHSVRAGVESLTEGYDLIAVQDGVRPLVSRELILRTVECAAQYGAAVPVVLPVDSFREVEAEGGSHIVDRSQLRVVQTPQIFAADILRAAYDVESSAEFTDDASVVERAGFRVALTEGERQNIKITTPEDLYIAEALLDARRDME